MLRTLITLLLVLLSPLASISLKWLLPSQKCHSENLRACCPSSIALLLPGPYSHKALLILPLQRFLYRSPPN